MLRNRLLRPIGQIPRCKPELTIPEPRSLKYLRSVYRIVNVRKDDGRFLDYPMLA